VNTVTTAHKSTAEVWTWQQAVAKYTEPDIRRSLWQVANSVIPYLGLWYLAYRSLSVSYWLALAVSVLAAGFLMRIFIIFHDCGHGAFFKSRKANEITGIITGVLNFTPFHQWRYYHAVHHATSGDLERRGDGDIWLMTVDEYLAAPLWKRLLYRTFRHPIVLFVIGPLSLFLIYYRLPSRQSTRRARNSVLMTNVILLAILGLMSITIGIRSYLLVQLPIMFIAGVVGVWLFYVQHNFEGSYWARHEEWDYVTAALYGSSYYKLPRLLQWFSGNIGFHHIHHLSSRIPNYYLERCHDENPRFQAIEPISFLTSLQSLNFRLWDEDNRQFVGFGHLKP
jgi:acyl-lipid omega-6 desaturase (Delta-12 desaturase)